MRYDLHKMTLGETKNYGYCDTDRDKIRASILRSGLKETDFRVVAMDGKYNIIRISK